MCMMSVLLPTFSPVKKNKSTVTAGILEQKKRPEARKKKYGRKENPVQNQSSSQSK